jgi:hypothetical protein
MGVEKLSSLFLRLNTISKGPSTTLKQTSSNGKTVGFNMAVETWDNGPYDSFGGGGADDDDGGPGLCFADNADEDNANGGDDFFARELHDVRKVDKVHVGHATVRKRWT